MSKRSRKRQKRKQLKALRGDPEQERLENWFTRKKGPPVRVFPDEPPSDPLPAAPTMCMEEAFEAYVNSRHNPSREVAEC